LVIHVSFICDLDTCRFQVLQETTSQRLFMWYSKYIYTENISISMPLHIVWSACLSAPFFITSMT